MNQVNVNHREYLCDEMHASPCSRSKARHGEVIFVVLSYDLRKAVRDESVPSDDLEPRLCKLLSVSLAAAKCSCWPLRARSPTLPFRYSLRGDAFLLDVT